MKILTTRMLASSNRIRLAEAAECHSFIKVVVAEEVACRFSSNKAGQAGFSTSSVSDEHHLSMNIFYFDAICQS